MDIKEKELMENTATVKDLKKMLRTLPDNMKVFMSIDPEGNGYSTVSKETQWCLGLSYEDNAMILYPYAEGYQLDDIMPVDYEQATLEMEADNV